MSRILSNLFAICTLASVACAQCPLNQLIPVGMAGSGYISQMVLWDPDGPGPRSSVVVVAGTLSVANTTSAKCISMWDPSSGAWSSFPSDVTSADAGDVWLSAITVLNSGDLVAAGAVSELGHLVSTFLVRWDGSSWVPLATPTATPDGPIFSMLVLPNGDLIAGGDFTSIGDIQANHIARWNGTTWAPLADGSATRPTTMTTLPDGDLVVGGWSEHPQNFSLSRWNGSSWSLIPNDFVLGVCNVATLPTGELVAAGGLYTPEGVPIGRVAKFDGQTWTSYGPDVINPMVFLSVLPNGDLLASGEFTRAGRPDSMLFARWNGSAWTSLGSGLDQFASCSLVLPNGDILVGGSFSSAGGKVASGIARWNGSDWFPLNAGLSSGQTYSGGRAIAPCPDGSAVIAGGFFAGRPDAPLASMVANWRGNQFSAYGTGLDSAAYAVAALRNGDIVVSGDFRRAGEIWALGIARWDGYQWSDMEADIPFPTHAYSLVALPNGDLIAGGNFITIGGITANGIARWDGVHWFPLDTGLHPTGSSTAQALLALPNGNVIVGGNFDHAGNVSTRNIARWNGSAWSALGPGMQSGVCSLALAPDGGIYAGTQFNSFQNSVDPVKRWNGTSWSSLGGNVRGWTGSSYPGIYALAVTSTGDLIAGGSFDAAAGTPARNLARYSNGTWSELAGGTDDSVLALCMLPNSDLLIGGKFTHLGAAPSFNFARLTCNACPADFNHDNTLNLFDYLDFIQAFATTDPSADFNHDFAIDFFDYLDFVQSFSTGC